MMKTKVFLLTIPLFFILAAKGQSGYDSVKVDTLITGFHYGTNYSGTKVYTKNGQSDLLTGKLPSAFSVTVSNKVLFEQAKGEVFKLLLAAGRDGYRISELYERDTIVNGNEAHLISYKESFDSKNYENLVFNGVVNKGKFVIVFTSGDLDKGKYTELFKETFFKLRF